MVADHSDRSDEALRMSFELPCPGVLELPDRRVQFFNLWHDTRDGAGDNDRVVMLSIPSGDDATGSDIGPRRLVDLRPGDALRIGRVELRLVGLEDPVSVRRPIVGELRPV